MEQEKNLGQRTSSGITLTMDLPPTQSRMFIYADDNAIACQAQTFAELQDKLNAALDLMSKYYKDWRLRPNPGKTVHCVFHLNTHRANHRLELTLNGEAAEYVTNPIYLGNAFDRSLTYRANSERIKSKLKPRVNLIQKLAGSSWGCSATTLRITTQAMVLSVAEYCAPV